MVRVGAEGDELGVEQLSMRSRGQQLGVDEALQPEPVDERHEHVGDVRRRPMRCRSRRRACAVVDPLHHELAPHVVVAVLQRAQRRLVEGAGPEVDVERELERPPVVERERLLQDVAQRRRGVDVGGDPLEALLDLVVGPLQRRAQDVVLGREVVGERAGRVARTRRRSRGS